MEDKKYQLLKKYFGYDDFRYGQKELIDEILSGRDVLGIMPTGAGKSICYQIPALVMDGITVVISPLISLMKDQVDTLLEMGIEAAFINSSLSDLEYRQVIEGLRNNQYKLIYVAPERFEMEGFINILSRLHISLIAVDEAHCVSQWGHDFRPSYTNIANIIQKLPSRPLIAAFTATATPIVRKDIIKLLQLKKPFTITTGFDRENIYFEVVKNENKFDFIHHYLQENKTQSGLIYCSTRKTVDSVYKKLKDKGYKVRKYHAGLSEDERSKSQEDFLYDKATIMVATNAFGMGIDKSNIRFVLHYNMPKNIESYYQEAGRAGRDGLPSNCVLLYSPADTVMNKFLIEQSSDDVDKQGEYKKLYEMVDYCNTEGCLRTYILNYFGDKVLNTICNNCSSCNNEVEEQDITIEAQKIMSCIKRMNERFGTAMVANVLKGSKNSKVTSLGFHTLPTYGIMKEYKIESIKEIIGYLIAENIVFQSGDKYPTLALGQSAYDVLKGHKTITIKRVLVKEKAKKGLKDKGNKADNKVVDMTLFESLRELRMRIAKEQRVPPFVVFSDATLNEMCIDYPTTEEAFLEVSGVGQFKLEKYGEEFITAIKNFVDSKDQ
ncbi:RecQ-like ATP-dependent DNA helicase [Natranaerovirga pectinivora]|uniref:DNA helicase RecQ n=1 Tax=Natranaerovirga pectinivora TaxID=682400 RepID=A0A4R3MMG1_9FIRM|nr:RecQ-like ATP-dependent DNA helicase [Natranaerovirga pectinivora]